MRRDNDAATDIRHPVTTLGVVRVRSVFILAVAIVLLACGDDATAPAGIGPTNDPGRSETSVAVGPTATSGDSRPTGTTATEPARTDGPSVVLQGTVVAAGSGAPLAWATVSTATAETTTGADGGFSLKTTGPGDPITVDRAGWLSAVIDPAALDSEASGTGAGIGSDRSILVELEPFVARGLRVSRTVAADRDRFEALLALADDSIVNTLVFDTKDETGSVLYETEVDLARRSGAMVDAYRPAELLALAEAHGLYTVTRIVTFEDPIWSAADREAALAGSWVDAADQRNWRYPIDLAVEACRLGFREIQFDYVRFPAGRTATAAADRIPGSSEARTAVISGFLDQAGAELRPLGCELSAAVFGIVMSSPGDEGIGQGLEEVSASVGAVSPMLYPSHYSAGWLGFPDPNEHPGPVIADALDQGAGRLASTTQLRPWLQAFSYNADQVRAQITEAEQREAGWILWNASGNYRLDWLPPS